MQVAGTLGGSRLNEQPQEIIVIPHADLTADTLRRVVESFVLREGTDYGQQELSLDQKVAHVMRQLQRGEAQIIFDSLSQTVDLVLRVARQRKR